jgi:hypothetical protein
MRGEPGYCLGSLVNLCKAGDLGSSSNLDSSGRLDADNCDFNGVDKIVLSSHIFSPDTFFYGRDGTTINVSIGLENTSIRNSTASGKELETSIVFSWIHQDIKVQICNVLLIEEELCIYEIMDKLESRINKKIPRATLSGFLIELTSSGILKKRISGTKAYFSINTEYCDLASAFIENMKCIIYEKRQS